MISRRLFAAVVLVATPFTTGFAQRADTVRISIADALTRVLRESDEIRIGQAQFEVTGAQVTQARASGLPALNLRGSYTQQTRNARAAIVSTGIFGQNYTYTTTLALTQPIFQGGRIFAGMRAAGEAREASRHNLLETRSRLTMDAHTTYLGVILARELVVIQEENAKLAEGRLAQVQQLEKAGRASRYDLLKARVDRANLEPALLQARSNATLAEIELKQLLNYPSNAVLVLTNELDTAALRASVAEIVNSVASGGVSRSSVRAAEATVDVRREGVRIARADFMPTVSAFFNNGYTALPSTSGFPTVWVQTAAQYCPPGSEPTRVCQNNGWYPDRSFGVQMAWPIFDGLRTKGAVDLASAQERVARAQLDLTRELVAVEVARAQAEFTRADAVFNTLQQNTAEADEAYRIAALRFERGLGTQLEVNDAQFALLNARVNAARATIDYYLAAAELARSHGREVSSPADASRLTLRTPNVVRLIQGLAFAGIISVAAACGGSDDEANAAEKGSDKAPGPTPQTREGGAGVGGTGGARGRGMMSLVLGPNDVHNVTLGSIELAMAIQGDLKPVEEVPVRARIEGNLEAVNVREGDRVGRGQVMARFESSAEVGAQRSAQADVESAKADSVNAQWNADQSAELFKAGAIPERDLRTSQQSLVAAQARLSAAHSRLFAASRDLEDTKVLAPTSGIVSVRNVENGESVSRGAQLFTVVRNDVLELEAAVPSRFAGDVRPSMPVRFNANGREMTGRVARVSPTINPANRSVTIYLQLTNPGGTLKGNTFATGRIVARTISGTVVVPTSAIRYGQAQNAPFVYRIAGDEVQHQNVQLGIVDESSGVVQITQGVEVGDRIIVGNVGAIGRGVKVRIAGASGDPSSRRGGGGGREGGGRSARPDSGAVDSSSTNGTKK